MDAAKKELRRVLVSELGVDMRSLSGPFWENGWDKSGAIQWGKAKDGIAVYAIAFEKLPNVLGLLSDGTKIKPVDESPTAADFGDDVLWLAWRY